MFKLRDYQERAVDKIMWSMKLDGNDIVVLPTGSGKSIVIAETANRLQQDILILQPSKEILEQNVAKMRQYVHSSDIGLYSASVGKKFIRRYTFATIGSIYQRPELFEHINLVLIDECDLVNQKRSASMYNSFLTAIGRPKVVGFTATPFRIVTAYHKIENRREIEAHSTLKLINRMQPFFWNRLLVNVNNSDLTEQGYLSPLRYEDPRLFDHEDIPLNKSRTDFDLDAYEVRLGHVERALLDRLQEARKEFKSILVFCSSVRQAEKFAIAIRGSEVVSSKTDRETREHIINGFKNGTIPIVFNFGVLTTGFDHPSLDCIISNRPTRSLRLHYQMLGRGVRIAPGKEFCQIIDFSGNVRNLGRIHTIKMVKREKWEIETETGSWHNKALYSYVIKMQNKKQQKQSPTPLYDIG